MYNHCSTPQGVRDNWWDLATVTSEQLRGRYSVVKSSAWVPQFVQTLKPWDGFAITGS